MKEEDIIHKYDSGRNPFQTPAGYFENFTPRLMARIKAEEERQTAASHPGKPATIKPLRLFKRYAAAATFLGLCFGTGAYLYHRQINRPSPSETMADYVLNEGDLDEVLDYEMVDNNRIAYYLTEAY